MGAEGSVDGPLSALPRDRSAHINLYMTVISLLWLGSRPTVLSWPRTHASTHASVYNSLGMILNQSAPEGPERRRNCTTFATLSCWLVALVAVVAYESAPQPRYPIPYRALQRHLWSNDLPCAVEIVCRANVQETLVVSFSVSVDRQDSVLRGQSV